MNPKISNEALQRLFLKEAYQAKYHLQLAELQRLALPLPVCLPALLTRMRQGLVSARQLLGFEGFWHLVLEGGQELVLVLQANPLMPAMQTLGEGDPEAPLAFPEGVGPLVADLPEIVAEGEAWVALRLRPGFQFDPKTSVTVEGRSVAADWEVPGVQLVIQDPCFLVGQTWIVVVEPQTGQLGLWLLEGQA